MLRTCALALATALFATTATAQTPPATTPAAPPAADAPIPAAVFAQLPRFESPRLSPDGTRIAAKMAIDGVQSLVVMPLFDGKPAALKVGENMDINWWRWVGDKWLVAGIGSQSHLGGEDIYITRMVGLSADLRTLNRIDWSNSGIRADDLLWSAKDGSPRILFARSTGIDTMADIYPSVWDADVSTGKVRRVAASQPDVWDWYADGAGTLRMGIRYIDDTGRGALLYRGSNAESFRTIARSDSRKEQSFIVPTTFRADGIALATSDSGGRDALYEVSLPDLTLGKKVYDHPGYDIDGVVENRDGNDVLGISVTDTFDHIVWLDPALKKVQAAADAAVGNRRARIVSRSASGSQMLVEVGSPSQAGALYYWDLGSDRMQRYAFQNDTLAGRSLSPVKTVHYTARDGTAIEAILTLPRHRPNARNLPLIVLPHGGPIARDSEGWDWWVQYLAEQGYAVIQPNYRGSSGYGTAFVKAGEGEWGLKMQDDLNDAITFLAKEGIADPKRVCIAGASYGGYAALRAAQRDGALYRCAISYAGVSDLAGIKKYDAQFLNGKTLGRYWTKRATDLHAVSPRFGADQVTIPVLLLHGKADKRVPVKQSRQMADALKSAGKPYQYIEQPLGDHHFTRSQDRLEFLTAMGAFLAKYNPA
ncbi:alpha/beta hydrolase family protein [Sphingomonas melonis]